MNNREHWDDIFSRTDSQQLAWQETDIGRSLDLLSYTSLQESDGVFICGAGHSELIRYFYQQRRPLYLNDISPTALAQVAEKLNTVQEGELLNEELVHYLPQDISATLPAGIQATLWFDRAVLHFLLEETAVEAYFCNLDQVLVPGGYVILSEFAKGGAQRCAGLDIRQYDVDLYAQHLGPQYRLLHSQEHVFINLHGQEKPYASAVFQKLAP